MFEEVEGRHSLSKREFKQQAPGLRVDLLNAQFDLRKKDFSVLVVLAGDDRPACDEVIDRLHEWLDAREMETHVFLEPSPQELERPRFWRYWQALPARGRIGIHLGGWATQAVAERVRGDLPDDAYDRRLSYIRALEHTLVTEGTLLLKFWFHLSRKEHKKRLKKAREDPAEELYVDEQDWKVYQQLETALPVAQEVVGRTSTDGAPWIVVDASDRESRDVMVAKTLIEALAGGRAPARPSPALDPIPGSALGAVDLTSHLERDAYKERLEAGQSRLNALSRAARRMGLTSVLVFEGWDAAGKGGCIRRLTRAMAARDYRVVSIAAPTEEEQAHHYLWRFWRQLSRAGKMTVFDRSWYGRVLVERIEGFAAEHEWRRAYGEIREFEDQLVRHGIVLLKFWLHVGPEEQLRRFRAREQTPYKQHKITDEDYRNRERWGDYVAAVDEMVARTDRPGAPWHLVPADDKRFARIQVLETVCRALDAAI